jgi:hypothetical protein
MLTAETLAERLGGGRSGVGWLARCPAHTDRQPSLSLQDTEDGKVLVYCHAGCDQRHVIAELRARGLWDGRPQRRFLRKRTAHPANALPDRDEAKRTGAALGIWKRTTPAGGTPVESYLAARGLHLPPPPTLRFHAGMKHHPSGGFWPAMVALVTRGVDDTPIGIHRTFLSRDGNGKAPVEPQKMMLGPCRGGAVRLAPAGDVLMIGEGIETCLAAMQATGKPAWAALSTAGMRGLSLPIEVCDVIVLADGDEPGEAAARDCALRWKREGRRVRIARPPKGSDFNDLIMGRAPRIGEAAV